MSDDNAEKAPGALVLLSQAIDLAQAANDDCKRLSALLAASKAEVAVERTRADKAEAEVARLREAIDRAYQAGLMHSGKAAARILGNEIGAVPVEPQGDHEGGA